MRTGLEHFSSNHPPAEPGALSLVPRSKRHRGRCAAPIGEPPEGGINHGKARIAACHGAGSSSGFFFGSAPCRIFTFVVYLLNLLPRRHIDVLGDLPSKCRRWSPGRDCRNCQTSAASPAEPGDLPGY